MNIRVPEQLPVELVEILCGYFTGFDAFNLSLTDSWWRKYLLDEDFWTKCFSSFDSSTKTEIPWKKLYAQARSSLFQVLQANGDTALLDSYSYLSYGGDKPRWTHFQLTHIGGKSFSFDIWFSLLPSTDGEIVGGIIYGIQTSSRESCEEPHYHDQYVMVSSTGDLYCSILPTKSIVASNIQPNRWNHVALTYDHEVQHQQVYFNGAKVESKYGTWRYTWHFMMHGQVGTGWSIAEAPNCPHQDYRGWFGFHGVIDKFRAWNVILPQEDITKLASGEVVEKANLQASLQAHGIGTAKLVKCTRPTEATKMQLIM
ncbi:hypothetical protein PHMEG_00017333 [Phytophthora megakarya]|uniref:F-box domain-containing protein n=1 Tax=Phytophthora megakarya TaxID=4795 RepID=A0A225VX18_9STRA|nr:hypothetical protein PHMEG_00017333 [Phytophthora megakarya]